MKYYIKQKIKSLIGRTYFYSSIASKKVKNHITIFMFHDVSEESTEFQKNTI